VNAPAQAANSLAALQHALATFAAVDLTASVVLAISAALLFRRRG
jgi:hypothetical protein